MPVTNQILQFAGGGGANVLSPAAYAALTSIVANGFSAGVLPSNQLNVVLRQSAFVSAMIAQFIADQSGLNVNDDGNLATLEANFGKAIQAFFNGASGYALDTGTANVCQVAYTPAVTTLVDGTVLRYKAKFANTGATTFAPNAVVAAPIVTPANVALTGGEITVNGDVWLQYNSSFAAWVLMSPALIATQAQTIAGTDDTTIVTPLKLRNGFAFSFGTNGYFKLPSWLSGWMVQWGVNTSSASADVAVTFPIAFPNATYGIIGTVGIAGSGGFATTNGLVGLTGFNLAAWSAVTTRIANSVQWLAWGR